MNTERAALQPVLEFDPDRRSAPVRFNIRSGSPPISSSRPRQIIPANQQYLGTDSKARSISLTFLYKAACQQPEAPAR